MILLNELFQVFQDGNWHSKARRWQEGDEQKSWDFWWVQLQAAAPNRYHWFLYQFSWMDPFSRVQASCKLTTIIMCILEALFSDTGYEMLWWESTTICIIAKNPHYIVQWGKLKTSWLFQYIFNYYQLWSCKCFTFRIINLYKLIFNINSII